MHRVKALKRSYACVAAEIVTGLQALSVKYSSWSDVFEQVRRGMLVYDPFVGTGSILIAAAHHGAMTLGADIDPRVISLGKVCSVVLRDCHTRRASVLAEYFDGACYLKSNMSIAAVGFPAPI